MSDAEQEAVELSTRPLGAASVLAASIQGAREQKGIDLELVDLLESTILRVDALDGASESAATAIRKLAASRAESRMGSL